MEVVVGITFIAFRNANEGDMEADKTFPIEPFANNL
jgi:hypothetical protein